jgi:hypothetical protein
MSLLLKDSRKTDRITFEIPKYGDDGELIGIRCPLCQWRPSASNLWYCARVDGSVEPFFIGCGTAWNTFLTGALCPGCSHQWHWTTCLRCGEASLHEDWYEHTPQERTTT